MSEVAARAGVSLSTVSHVLNDTRPVNPDTRDRVEKAVAELGYRRNAAARTLAGGRSHAIGLVISGLTNPYFGPLLQTIERCIAAAGYVLILGDSHDETEMETVIVDSLLERRVDGFIVAPSAGFVDHTAARITSTGTPLVLIDRGLPLDCDQVVPENRRSARELTEHLIQHGHSRIGAVVGLRGLDSTEDRLLGYRDAMDAAGLAADPALIVEGASRTEVAQEAVERMLTGADRPTALITMNNAMTIGALRAAVAAGCRIPADLALAAYDDFEWSDLFEPGLTATAQDVQQMGEDAVELLLGRIAGGDEPAQRRVIDTTFHRRTSCGCR